MRTLGEIETEYAVLEETLLQLGGDITDEQVERFIDDWLSKLGDERNNKLDGYCALIEENELQAASRRAAADRLQQLAATNGGLAKRLRGRLEFYFQSNGIRRVDTTRYKISLQAHGGKLPVLIRIPAAQLPSDLVRVNVTIEPDKDAIRARLEAGETIAGVELAERGESLRIK